ncbi:tannase/feruloyl esterase family alpha/beta hydrolase (plasmid) [Ralstonia syzygii subsp. celebesensis]|uniref:Tannase/feruloyl esterase family alpha/beta hydrolase n=2 Tax=Ralstonia solanacearum species complex TaxID=3116862 RepID=A0AAD0SDA3_RALSL|nr:MULTISPECIES: tannase/feruloyl esterase family alpha/beta hydrolase [Ralstonia solanacearum species complex]CCA82891.1 conserved hypothethical protein [blood disease bacterium R229]AXV84593.1 tannase/feruloyl esterase family alpha/beta hydrolase [Ralstonia solanacearum]AXW55719.1 tannase/feruloyl esterase family alpha/beta hydrolase [Ralstonia solanacearum]QQV57504.1 tannase/feruloyl esterase family alpha/beta hydrolase [Ralstonia syzygii subsp. celebesensis]CBJ36015.1 conserved hypothethic
MKTVMAHGMTLAALALSLSCAAGHDRIRPLCRRPKVARHTGTGDRNDASRFRCE